MIAPGAITKQKKPYAKHNRKINANNIIIYTMFILNNEKYPNKKEKGGNKIERTKQLHSVEYICSEPCEVMNAILIISVKNMANKFKSKYLISIIF